MSPTMPQTAVEAEENQIPDIPVQESEEFQGSATGQQLRKLRVVQKASQVYNGVTDLCGVTRGLAKTVANTSNGVCKIVLKTKPGQKADEVIANMTKQMQKAEEKCLSWVPGGSKEEKNKNEIEEKEGKVEGETTLETEKSEEQKNPSLLKTILVTPIHLYFRFFPLCMFLRWFVHCAFLVSQTALALSMDLARPDGGNRRVRKQPEQDKLPSTKEEASAPAADSKSSDGTDQSKENSSKKESTKTEDLNTGNATEGEPDTDTASKPKHETRASGTIASMWESFLINTYAIFYLLDVYIFIPYLVIQTWILEAIDVFLFNLAGLGSTEEDRKDRHLMEETVHGLSHKISRRKWIADVTTDIALGQAMRFPVLGFCLWLLGFKRPAKPFQTLARWLRNCPKHDLKDDSNDGEQEGPDYEAGCSYEDSLAYKDKLEPDVPIDHLETMPKAQPMPNGNIQPTPSQDTKDCSTVHDSEEAAPDVRESQEEGGPNSGDQEEVGPSDISSGSHASNLDDSYVSASNELEKVANGHDPCMLDQVADVLESVVEHPDQRNSLAESSINMLEQEKIEEEVKELGHEHTDVEQNGERIIQENCNADCPADYNQLHDLSLEEQNLVSPFKAISLEHSDSLIRLDLKARCIGEQHEAQDENDRAGILYVGFSGVCSAVMMCDVVPMDYGVDPSVCDVDHLTYLRDGQEYSTAEEAGFSWDASEAMAFSGKGLLKLDWMSEYTSGQPEEQYDSDHVVHADGNGERERRLSLSPEVVRGVPVVHHSSEVDTGESLTVGQYSP